MIGNILCVLLGLIVGAVIMGCAKCGNKMCIRDRSMFVSFDLTIKDNKIFVKMPKSKIVLANMTDACISIFDIFECFFRHTNSIFDTSIGLVYILSLIHI